jgi:serine/threonine protein kinase
LRFRDHGLEGGKALDIPVETVLGGRYRVEGTLGIGGMAVVYKAEDTVLGRTVALKTLHRRYAEEPSFRRRFKQEARAMASLDHENIVKVYDISQEGEVPFIVAECVGGQDVGDMLRSAPRGRLKERFILGIAGQLLGALAYAHWRGVIHRDIKPSNILITHDGTVKVADFGIARLVEDGDFESGEIVGSARYMSPEQLTGREATPRSDIYSVGILLYHCLTGRPPFSGDVQSLARQQVRSEPTPPRRLNKRISPRVEAVVLKALAKDPEDRYPSADAMLDDLGSGPARRAARTSEIPRTAASRDRFKSLLAASAFAVLALGGGTALATGLGYVDLSGRSSEELGQAAPVSGEAPRPPEPSPGAESNPSSELVAVPDVQVYFDYWARRTLRQSGLKSRVVYEYREGYANRGVTWGTDPAIGTLVPPGTTVTIYATPKDESQPRL